jgi:protein arginine kinase activator
MATVHLAEIVDKHKREAHLCEYCARERKLLQDPPAPQIDLKALMHILMPPPLAAPLVEPNCASCGMNYASFKAEGRFGCEEDYEVFRAMLEPLLERIHRAVTHVGKRPTAAARLEAAREIEELRARMKHAVEAEDYEEAARLRDLIRQMETEGTPG